MPHVDAAARLAAQAARRARYKAAGRCRECPGPARAGKHLCLPCAVRAASLRRRMRAAAARRRQKEAA